MAYFPDVSPGDPFRPDAKLSNALRRMVNARNRNAAGKQLPATGITIVVWNASETEIEALSAVNFPEEKSFTGDAVPAVPLTDDSKPWGVVLGNIPKGQIGNCMVSGPVAVEYSGTGKRAKPSAASPRIFGLGADGVKVLYAGVGKAVINLGDENGFVWNGPYALSYDAETKKIKIGAGYLRRNGDFVTVSETEIEPATGIICVTSELKDEEWSAPEIVIAVPDATHYPIGKCTVKGESVTLDSYHVTVAVILETGPCPLINAS